MKTQKLFNFLKHDFFFALASDKKLLKTFFESQEHHKKSFSLSSWLHHLVASRESLGLAKTWNSSFLSNDWLLRMLLDELSAAHRLLSVSWKATMPFNGIDKLSSEQSRIRCFCSKVCVKLGMETQLPQVARLKFLLALSKACQDEL